MQGCKLEPSDGSFDERRRLTARRYPSSDVLLICDESIVYAVTVRATAAVQCHDRLIAPCCCMPRVTSSWLSLVVWMHLNYSNGWLPLQQNYRSDVCRMDRWGVKPKSHYADFPVTSATSPRQIRDLPVPVSFGEVGVMEFGLEHLRFQVIGQYGLHLNCDSISN